MNKSDELKIYYFQVQDYQIFLSMHVLTLNDIDEWLLSFHLFVRNAKNKIFEKKFQFYYLF